MTTLVTRPPGPRAPRRPPAGPPSRPVTVTVAGLVAAVQAAGLGGLAVMVVVLVGWATAPDGAASAVTAVTAGLQVWLVAHHTRLVIPGGAFSLAPVAAALLPVLVVHSASTRAARLAQVAGRRGAVALASAVTSAYAGIATLVALLARTDAVQPLPVSAFLGAGLLAALGSGSAVVRATGSWHVAWIRLPHSVREALPPALGALCVLLGGGALLVGLSLARHHDQAMSLTRALDAGAGGTALLLLGSLLYVPTAAVWGASFASGPGFAVGAGTSVTAAGSDLGAVPTVPLLAALPETPDTGAGVLALLLPVAAGMLAALLLRRRATAGLSSWREVLRVSAVTGGLVGTASAVLASASAGSAGPGRMAEAGPDWWAVGLAAGSEMAVVMALALLLLRRLDAR